MASSKKQGEAGMRPVQQQEQSKPSFVSDETESVKPVTATGKSYSDIPVYAGDSIIQPKLSVNTPGDKYEQEANTVADEVTQTANTDQTVGKKEFANISSLAYAKGEPGEYVSEVLNSRISSSKGKGNSLDQETQSTMSGKFGVDFSKVKIHADDKAATMNREINAKAFTVGNDIYFNKDQYKPSTKEGKQLLAHELTHVTQQGATLSTQGADHSSAIQRKAAEPATEKVGGTLWAKDAKGNDLLPSLDDISQGGVNDCFLFAAMAGIVHSNPGKVMNMIKDNGNGTYTVTFEGIGFFSSAEQTVSADFWVGKRGDVKARNAIWPLVIEKAYIQEKGGLSVVDKEGGNGASAVDDMIDEGPTRFDPRDESVSYIMGKVKEAMDEKWPAILTSPTKEGSSTAKKELAGKIPNLHFWHAYTIIDVDPKMNRLKLFNPWGKDHPNHDGWVDVSVIQTFFIEIAIND